MKTNIIIKGFAFLGAAGLILQVGYTWGRLSAKDEDLVDAAARKRIRAAADRLQIDLALQRKVDKEFHDIVGE